MLAGADGQPVERFGGPVREHRVFDCRAWPVDQSMAIETSVCRRLRRGFWPRTAADRKGGGGLTSPPSAARPSSTSRTLASTAVPAGERDPPPAQKPYISPCVAPLAPPRGAIAASPAPCTSPALNSVR
eukprot:8165342-Pyramimonas_sp.AAC.1